MNNFTWLHFSDLHFNSKESSDSTMARKRLNEFLTKQELNPTYIFITGDIVNQSIYSEVDKNIKEMISSIDKSERTEYDKFIFWSPGNHDIVRSDTSTRTKKLEILSEKEKTDL